MDVIKNHKEDDVRLCAIRVLGSCADVSLSPRLRELVGGENISESVRTAVLELLYKFDHEAPMEFEPGDIQPVTLHNSP